MKSLLLILLTELILGLNVHSSAQGVGANGEYRWIWERATPFITNYTKDEYKAHGQNWCFEQDSNGIIYAGNTQGLLEYDGVKWRLIPLPNGSPVKSMAKTADGTIFIGAVNELGFIKSDSIGRTQYVSMLGFLDTSYHDVADIWFTYAIGNAVFFISNKYIFRWHNNEFRIWKATDIYGFAWLIDSRLYVHINEVGLLRLEGNEFLQVPGGDQLRQMGITTLLPLGNNKLMAIEAVEGVYFYEKGRFSKPRSGIGDELIDKIVIGGIALPGGDSVIKTAGNGIYILDSDGRIKKQITRDDGLSSNVILGLYVDQDGDLWVATENGIDRIELGSGLRRYGENNNLMEYVNDISVFHDRIFAATNDGLLYLEKADSQPALFKKIPEILNQSWDLATVGNRLFFANFNGFGTISDRLIPEYLLDANASYVLPTEDSSRLIIGTQYGKIYTLKKVNDEWITGADTLQIPGRVLRLTQDNAGDIWIGSRYSGVYRIQPDTIGHSFLGGSTITSYDTSSGLVSPEYNVIKIMNDQIYVVSQKHVYQYDESRDRFTIDSFFDGFRLHHSIQLMGEMFDAHKSGYLFFAASPDGNHIYQYENNQINPLKISNRFSAFTPEKIVDLDEDILLICGDKGIIVMDKNTRNRLDPVFPVQLRKISIMEDSVLFSGNTQARDLELPYRKTVMRFEFALPAFDKPEAVQYQSFLENFDEDWTSWTYETQRDFTNLPEGDYIFHVRAQNEYDEISGEDIFAFTVNPPIHRTWWAYLLYGLAAFSLLMVIVQWRSNQLRKEKLALEGVVAERTLQLALQAEKLKDMDRRKSRFFANISHEFRTPLTLIKGPVDQVIDQPERILSTEDVDLIRHNANRLLQLVNQLLDLSRLDAGKMELNTSKGELFPFLKAIASAFSSYASLHSRKYKIKIPDSDNVTDFDQDKLEKIVNNLLANAFKFTPENGSVTFKAYHENEHLIMTVSDTGIGIDEAELSSVFNRFYQADDSSTRTAGGMGIGLALTKELVSLMNGDIRVESNLGEGTIFIVTLPLTLENTPLVSDLDDTTKDSYPLPLSISESPHTQKEMVADILPEAEVEDKPQILIVEDHMEMRQFIASQLEKQYSISEAANGQQGLEMAREFIPDLVITDLMMPQMDGMVFCHKLKSDLRISHIPVIMLTAKASINDKIEGLETGADSFLTKPFDHKELQVRVRNLIEQRLRLRERYSKTILLQPQDIAVTPVDAQFLQSVKEILENNFGDDGFGVPQMQDALHMSKTQLHRKMKALTNHPPGEFLRNYRLKRAAQILSKRGDSVTQVAYSVGFNNLSYFTRCFKELYGVLPSDYADSQTN